MTVTTIRLAPGPSRLHPRAATAPVAAVVAILIMILTGCGADEPQPFAGYARMPTPTVAEVSLPSVEADGTSTPFTFAAPQGDLLLVYFGYTSCPDVCPTTLSDVRNALTDLGDDSDDVQLAMVTIDPEIDSAEILTNYVRSFVPTGHALRTDDDAQLRAAANAFGADYGKDDGEVYHTGSLYAIDDQGELVLTWPFGVPTDDLASDIGRLLAGDRA